MMNDATIRIRQPMTLRAGGLAMGVLFLAFAVVLFITDGAVGIVLGMCMLVAAWSLPWAWWRSAIEVQGDVLIVQSSYKQKRIARTHINSIDHDGSDVIIGYTQDGEARRVSSDAATGLVNLLGAKWSGRTARTERVAEQLTAWRHTGAL